MASAKNIYSKVLVSLPKLVLLLLTISCLILGYYYYKGTLSTETVALLGGLLSGLVLVIVQFLMNWYEYSKMSKFQSLRINDILLHRDDREFYQKLIEKAEKRIDVLGVTAARFMEHFADTSESSRPESRVLVTAMAKGVQVRILVPARAYLKSSGDQSKFDIAEGVLKETAESNVNFKYLYFEHEPAHSIVVIDDECLIGPVLPKLPSRNTPAIYLNNNSAYAKNYLDYFEDEWQQADSIKK